MIEPTRDQIKRCGLSGWEYLGDGIFCRGELLGWFEQGGFVKTAASQKLSGSGAKATPKPVRMAQQAESS